MEAIKANEINEIIRSQIENFDASMTVAEVGTVIKVGDGIAEIHGLEKVMAGELLEFPHEVRGLALNLEEDKVGAVLFGEFQAIKEGDPVERIAPGIIDRQPVKEPLQTGLKALDSMVPIGRGQRELIIGDRQTGKTAVAIDTFINQKEINKSGKESEKLYCIYVAIGQKRSTVAQIVRALEENGAMEYSIVEIGR